MGTILARLQRNRRRAGAAATSALLVLAAVALVATRGAPGGPPRVGPAQLTSAAWGDGYNHFLVTIGGPGAPRPPERATDSDPVLWEPGWPHQAYVANLAALEAQGWVVHVYTQPDGAVRAALLNQSPRLAQVSLMRAAMNTPAPPALVRALAAHPGIKRVRWLTPGLVSIETRHSARWVQRLPGVTSVTPDLRVGVAADQVAWPDNPMFGEQWDLRNTGQSTMTPTGSFEPGTPGQDVNPLPAWDQTLGQGVTVAVLDMGVATSAPGLAQLNADSIQQAPNYNFVTNAPGAAADMSDCSDPPACIELHGTWVTSVLDSALDGAGSGLAGLAPGAQVLEEVVGTSGYIDTGAAVSAIYYALDHGARVLNLSWGGAGQGMAQEMLPVQAAIQQAQDDGALVVTAAGNFGQDNDPNNPNPLLNTNYDSFYPASFPNPNILSVGATDNNGARASFSNYGGDSVTLFAPGQDIWTASAGGDYVGASGTSLAAPLVAAAAAQIWSLQPTWSWQQVKQALEATASPDSQLAGLAQVPGVLNAGAALQYAAQGAMVSDFEGFGSLQAGQLGQTQVQISDPAAATATGPLDVRLSLALLDQGQPAAAAGIPVRWSDSAGSGTATTDAAGVITFPAPAGVATGASIQLGLDLPWEGQWGISVALVPASSPTTSDTLGARATLFDVGQAASGQLPSAPTSSSPPSGGNGNSGGGGSSPTSPSPTSPSPSSGSGGTNPTSPSPTNSSPSSGSSGGGGSSPTGSSPISPSPSSGSGGTNPTSPSPTSSSPSSGSSSGSPGGSSPTGSSPTGSSPSSGSGQLDVTPPSQQQPPSSPGASPTPVPDPTPVGNYPASGNGGTGGGTSSPTSPSGGTGSSSSGSGGGQASPTGIFGLESVQPSVVPTSGGAQVVIYGTKIPAGAGVLIGGQSAQVISDDAPSSILVVAPAAQAGAYSVEVVAPDGQSQTLPDALTYQAVTPGGSSGGTGGGTTSPTGSSPTSSPTGSSPSSGGGNGGTSPTSPSSGSGGGGGTTSPTSSPPSSGGGNGSTSPSSPTGSSPSSGSGGGGGTGPTSPSSGGGGTSPSSGGGGSSGSPQFAPPAPQSAPADWGSTPSAPTLYPLPSASQADSDLAGAYPGEWVAYPPAGSSSPGFAV